ESLARQRPGVTGIGFSRNFGKEAALMAGLDACEADCVIVMDADLQHPPELLPRMIQAWQEGYQVGHGVKRRRQGEPWDRRLCSGLTFGMTRALSGLRLQDSSDFKLLDAAVVRCYRELGEQHLFFRGLVDWLGFRSTQIRYDVAPRFAGTSRWGVARLAAYTA